MRGRGKRRGKREEGVVSEARWKVWICGICGWMDGMYASKEDLEGLEVRR